MTQPPSNVPPPAVPAGVAAGVWIDMKAIYDQVADVNSKVTLLIGQQDMRDKQAADHELRIRSLEAGRWPHTSLMIVVMVLSLLVGGAGLLLNLMR